MEAFLVFLLVIGGIILAATLFVAWVIATIVRGIARMVSPRRHEAMTSGAPGVQVCNNVQCQCHNPGFARFCRRCGKSLPTLLRVVPSRVAML